MKESSIKKIRKVLAIVILILFIIGLIKILPTFMNLVTEEGRIEFESQIEALGFKGAISIIALEICKIILVFLPGEPIELLAGMCFGPFIGLLVIYAGVMISNVLIIFAVKKYGIRLVKDIVPEDKIEKVEKMIHNHPEKSEVTLFVLYFLPVLPKDFITYIASLLPITKKKVLLISIFGRFPAVFSSVLVGSKILDGDIKSIIIIYLITYIISGLIVMIYKRKIAQEKREEKTK